MNSLLTGGRYRNNKTGSGSEPDEFQIPLPATPAEPQLPIINIPTLAAIGANDPYITRCILRACIAGV